MVFDRLAEEAERRFGLPPLSKFVETIDKLPDERRLKLIKEVLVVAERVSQTAPELDKVNSLIRELNSLPLDKLERVEKVLKRVERILGRIEKLLQQSPEELRGFLTELKQEFLGSLREE